MMQQIGEHIRVAVIFGPGDRVMPVWFDWRRRKYDIRQVTSTWEERQGTAILFHFAVSDGATLFELTYNATAHTWRLATTEAE